MTWSSDTGRLFDQRGAKGSATPRSLKTSEAPLARIATTEAYLVRSFNQKPETDGSCR